MTDRELVEMAAKAAGIELTPLECSQGDEKWTAFAFKNRPGIFSPLFSDGDALRLAVEMPYIDVSRHILSAWQESDTDEGRRAYVRRAITRAAAEFGKAMP